MTFVWAPEASERHQVATWIAGAPWRRGAGGETLELDGVLLDGTVHLHSLDLPASLTAPLSEADLDVRAAMTDDVAAGVKALRRTLETVAEMKRAVDHDRTLRAELAGERQTIVTALAIARRTLDPGAVDEVARLQGEVDIHSEDAWEPEDERERLQGEMRRQQEKLAALEAAVQTDTGFNIAATSEWLEYARAALATAEERIAKPDVDPALLVRLEALHEELTEVQDRTSSRIGGAKARKREEILEAEQQEILDQLGYVSYTSYVMGETFAADPLDVRRHETALAEFERADDAWRVVASRLDSDPEWSETLDRLDELEVELGQLVDDAPLYGPFPVTAEHELVAARARLADHEIAEQRVGLLERREAELAIDEVEAEESIEARLSLVAAAQSVAGIAADRLLKLVSAAPTADERQDGVVAAVLRAHIARREAVANGALPLVVDDCLDQLSDVERDEVRRMLVLASADVQVVFVTGSDSTLEWARSLGLDVASLLSLTGELAA